MPPTTQRPTITPEGKAAAERIAAARAERNANPTSVTADQLSQPVSQVTVPQPQVAETTPVNQNMVKGVGTNTQNIIAAQTEEAANLRGLREQQAQIAGEGTLSDLFKTQQEQFGIPENLKTLQDLQLQMADMNTESNVTQTRIGQGNSIAQGNREITQEQRENAVRQAGTAARAAIIQGNIETASALVSQAVQTAYQDRTLRNSNLINQINSLQGVVDNQTSQLLEADKRQYEEDQAVIQRVQDAVDDAMNSGAATQEDIRTLTDPKLSDEDRLAAAQGIVSRGQTQLRDLDVQAQESQLATQAAQRANIFDQIRSRKVAARERANTATEAEQETADKRVADTEQALELKGLASQLLNESGLSAAVGVGFKKTIVGAIPFVSGDAIAGSARADFEAMAERVANLLTLDNLDLMSGVLSETDIKILETAGSNLRNFDQSEEQYKEEINRIIDVMDRTIGNNGITEEQASFYGVADADDLAEINSIFE